MILGLFLAFNSCVKDSTTDQEQTIESSSTITSELMLTTLNATSFINDSGQLIKTIRIDSNFPELSSSTFFIDQLSKTNLTFKLSNSFEQEFKIDVEFLNDKDDLKYTLQIPVSSGTIEKPTTVETKAVIESPELATFKEATKIVYIITMLPDNEGNLVSSEVTLEIQSTANFFVDL